jgi:uncharacterized OB-fold protein
MTTAAEQEAFYRSALAEGRLVFPRCPFGHVWLPLSTQCPTCLADATGWSEAGGVARLISWVVYRRSFDPSTEERIPYSVALVELAEGPRLISDVAGLGEGGRLPADAPLCLRIDREGEDHLPRFVPAH